MINLHCWNDFDRLKTVILGSVYDNDKIPIRYENQDQDNFIKIVEETNLELQNIQKILEQLNVCVLRPKQPKNYNGLNLPHHDPTINMRDFFITYGNIFFTTYGPYEERRFQHFWLQDILDEITLSGHLIANSPEINLDGGKINYTSFLDDDEFFKIKEYPKYFTPKNLIHAERIYQKIFNDKNCNENSDLDFFYKHNLLYKEKTLFHTACVLKRNNKTYISNYGKFNNGYIWFENWLKHLNVTPIYIPKIGHIDDAAIFLNNETLLIRQEKWKHLKTDISNYFQDIKTIINLKQNSIIENNNGEVLHPTLWLKKWKKIYNTYNTVNCLVINPNQVLFNFYEKDFYDYLKNLGIEAIYVKWSNSEFWEGGLHCITCELERSLD